MRKHFHVTEIKNSNLLSQYANKHSLIKINICRNKFFFFILSLQKLSRNLLQRIGLKWSEESVESIQTLSNT